MKPIAPSAALALFLATGCSAKTLDQAQSSVESACAGTPDNAITSLPAPLSTWGTIVCTPYGHIISNHNGWIWSKPGGYSPVFIPSQMVRNNPEPIGNKSFFTEINFSRVDLDDPGAARALTEIQRGYSPDTPIAAYRLHVKGSLGRSLILYFFDWGDSANGIWCGQDGTKCDSNTAFMLLNMQRGS